MIYYHVWDNFPAPHFNGPFYRSTDKVVCISKVTHEILKQVAPEVESQYLPHAVNSSIFTKITDEEGKATVDNLRKNLFASGSPTLKNPNKKIFFWNNRNARRKQSGTLIWWFKEWLDKVGHDKALLLMHTDAQDPHGQDLPHIIKHTQVDQGQVMLSVNKVAPQELAQMYNVADFTINISDAEGFGLATLESLSCGTPIIVNMTGGLQEQVTDGKKWFGYGIQPSSKAVIGSLQVPYIYEDRISQEDFEKYMTKALKMPDKMYRQMASDGRKHVETYYNFDMYEEAWIKTMDDFIERNGSWEERDGYTRWHLLEVA